jgi:hypothetical protein
MAGLHRSTRVKSICAEQGPGRALLEMKVGTHVWSVSAEPNWGTRRYLLSWRHVNARKVKEEAIHEGTLYAHHLARSPAGSGKSHSTCFWGINGCAGRGSVIPADVTTACNVFCYVLRTEF